MDGTKPQKKPMRKEDNLYEIYPLYANAFDTLRKFISGVSVDSINKSVAHRKNFLFRIILAMDEYANQREKQIFTQNLN